VTVDSAPLGDASVEQAAATIQEARRQPLDLVESSRVDDLGREASHLREARLPSGAQLLEAGLIVYVRPAFATRMDCRELPGQPAEIASHVLALTDERRQATLLRHATHHHDRLVPTVREGEVGETEVHVRREAAVQLQLTSAGGRTLLPGREVEEPEVDRLLELVGAVTDEHEPCTVGLPSLEVRRPVGAHRSGRY
jgi:hypothetical protein